MHGRKTSPTNAAERALAQPVSAAVSRRSALKALGVAVPTAWVAASGIMEAPRVGALAASGSLTLGTVITPSGDTTGAKDHNAIQAALTGAIPGGTVILSPGTYYVNQSIVVGPPNAGMTRTAVPAPSLISLTASAHFGDALPPDEYGTVEIIATSTFPTGYYMLDYSNNVTNGDNWAGAWIKGMTFDCNNRGAGVRLCGVRGFHGEDITVYAAATPQGAGVYPDHPSGAFAVSSLDAWSTSGYASYFNRLSVMNCNQDGFYHNSLAQDVFVGCHALNARRYQYNCDYNSQVTFVACDANPSSSLTQVAAWRFLGCPVIMIGCNMVEMEGPPGNALRIEGLTNEPTQHMLISGCQFTNMPRPGVDEQAAALIDFRYTDGRPQAVHFDNCQFYAVPHPGTGHTNTTDFIYVQAACTGIAEFNNCTFTGTPKMHKWKDLSRGILRFRNCYGLNPVGLVSPGVPTSGKAVPAQPYDRTFYVTAAARGCKMAIQGGPSVVVPASQMGAVRVPAGHSVTPTYTKKPSWVVQGE